MRNIPDLSFREQIRLNLVSAMAKARINQVQLADRLRISKGTVNNWVSGNNSPDVEMMPKICDALGISISELFEAPQFAYITRKKPAPNEEDRLNQEIMNLFLSLSEEKQKEALSYLRYLSGSSETK